MVLNREITTQIKSVLKDNPQGLSITDIVAAVDINRNTAGRYLENLLVSGQVDMRQLGMAKIYTLSQRVPVSAVLSISSELIMQLDKNLRFIFANEPFLSFLSVSSTDLFGKNIEYSRVLPIFDEIYSEFIDRIRGGIAGTEWSGELALKERGIIFSCQIASTVFDNGQKGVSVILEDISEKKRAEEALRESEGKLNAMLQSIPDHMSMMDKDLNILWANETAKQCFGKDIVGKKCYEIYHRRQNPCEPYPCLTLQAFQDGKIHRHETSVIDIDGQTRFFECSANVAVNDESGKPVAVLEISRDITEHKQMENVLRESEERYRSIINSMQDAYFRADTEGRIILASPSATHLFRYDSINDLIGLPAATLYRYPEDRQEIIRIVKEQNEVHDFICEAVRKDGTSFWVSMNVQFTFDSKGNVTGTDGFIRDITERKRIESALQESEEKYRTLVERANDGICIVQDNIIKLCNPAIAAFWGGSAEEILGRNFSDFIHPDAVGEVIKLHTLRMAGEIVPSTYETILQRKDGSRFFAEVNAGICPLEGKPANHVVVRDINDRKKAEEALKKTEERFRDLINTTADIVWQTDAEKRFVYVSPQVEKILGYTPGELVGRTPFEFLDPVSVKLSQFVFDTAVRDTPEYTPARVPLD